MWDSESNFEFKKKPEAKAHIDYKNNLEWAIHWIKNSYREFPQDLVVKISDGHYLKKCNVLFCFQPDRFFPMGNYANPVFLHQEYSGFKKEIDKTYKAYCELIMKYREKFKEEFKKAA